MTTIAVLGLGEAGSRIAADLAAAGATVQGFDPAREHLDGVRMKGSDLEACRDADVVLSLTTAHEARAALDNALPGCRPGTLWADLNTSAPTLKEALRDAAGNTVSVVDVALMAPVPGRGLRTPMTASGPKAHDLAAVLTPYGAVIDVIDGPVGAAATRKLLRSVFYKGMSAAVTEALAAARQAGLEDWLAADIRAELTRSDDRTLDRIVEGSRLHAARREDEMAAAAKLLHSLGVPARVARASRDWLADLRQNPEA
ncbi:NAD(P)-dependent oxidoreductase [Actinoplanes solisilvae]|uniref:NAD(P)-dependent oxidoreductase n=1 Tax=Actinoplanes solisilvae TaxID=2486853 RepID=UPI000FD7E08E|nr:NAD(P)-dependent oxidoreductase [Actinoplanes solisilvae]